MVICDFFVAENCQTASEFILICRLYQYLTHICNPDKCYPRMARLSIWIYDFV